jgi:histidine ammonia-lyase
MGSIGGRKAYQVIGNVEKILGIELLCAAQALDFHRPLKSNKIIGEMHGLVRKQVTHAAVDRVFALDIEKTINMVKDGALLSVVHQEENYSTLKTNQHELFEVY